MLTLFRLFSTLMLIFFTYFVSYAYQDGIIAYVNDDVITSYDLENSVSLTEAVNKTKISNYSKQQILQTLIDEKLLFQIAKRNNIYIPKQQVKLHADEVAKNNGFANLAQLIMYYKINQKEFMKQIEAQLLLKRFIEGQIKPETEVSRQEVIDNIKTISQNVASSTIDGNTKVKIYKIVLYKHLVNQKDMSQLINNLYSQLQKGVSFESVAKQFSQSHSASSGGFVGSIKFNQLSKPIVDALKGKLEKFKTGYVTHPIELDDSVIVVRLADIKQGKEIQEQLSEAEVENILYNKKLMINLRNFVNNLRQSSYISIRN